MSQPPAINRSAVFAPKPEPGVSWISLSLKTQELSLGTYNNNTRQVLGKKKLASGE